MSQRDLNDYLEVLGFGAQAWQGPKEKAPQGASTEVPAQVSRGTPDLKVLFATRKDSMNEEAHALLNKMAQAMGLSRQDFQVHFYEDIQTSLLPVAQHFVLLLENCTSTRGQYHDFQSRPFLITHHPAELVQNAVLKKPTWDDLQQIIRELNY